MENPATKLRIKIENIAELNREMYKEMGEIYKVVCKIEAKING